MNEDFAEFIDQNEPVKEYLKAFPKQLMLLALEGKIVRFMNDESFFVNFNLLHRHLKSPESIFELPTVKDFIETLEVLGFTRLISQGKKELAKESFPSCRFWHPSFKPNAPVPDQVFVKNINKNQNQNQTTLNQNVQLFERILISNSRQRMTKSEFASMQLDFALNKELYELRQEAEIVDFALDEPEYKKSGGIAGYYGHNVSLDELKEAFQNLFPIYVVDDSNPIVEEGLENYDNMNISGIEEMDLDDENFLVEVEEIHIPPKSPPQAKPKPKKRKIDKKTIQLNIETQSALMYLHKESISTAADA